MPPSSGCYLYSLQELWELTVIGTNVLLDIIWRRLEHRHVVCARDGVEEMSNRSLRRTKRILLEECSIAGIVGSVVTNVNQLFGIISYT